MMLNTPSPYTKFGRLYAPDPSDRFYPMRAATLPALLRQERFWPTGPVLDQGPFPHCVGYAVHQFLLSAPFMMRKGRQVPGPIEIYHGAQSEDEWPGSNYDGTSGRGALKWLHKQGIIIEYRSAQDETTMKNYLLTEGGIMVGTEWFGGMTDPKVIESKKDGRQVWLDPSGEYQGGHETFWYGYSKKRDAYRVMNSWSKNWGDNGRAWCDRLVAQQLIFGMNGDAYSAKEVK